jgi:hypothetical protein
VKEEKNWPPNIKAIDKAFQVKDKPNVLYAYGTTIYNPSGVDIPEHLVVHELIHGERQLKLPSIDDWWDRYINEPQFRLQEEVIAHKGEWATFVKNYTDRNIRARHFHFMCQRLSGPIYGNMCMYTEARKRILGL